MSTPQRRSTVIPGPASASRRAVRIVAHHGQVCVGKPLGQGRPDLLAPPFHGVPVGQMVEVADEETARPLLETRAGVLLGVGVGHDDDVGAGDLLPHDRGVVVR